jgi:hypothetical protein
VGLGVGVGVGRCAVGSTVGVSSGEGEAEADGNVALSPPVPPQDTATSTRTSNKRTCRHKNILVTPPNPFTQFHKETPLAIGALVVAKLDRVALQRGPRTDHGSGQQNGWSLVLLDLNVDTSTPSGELVATVIGAMSQYESKLIGDRTAITHRQRKASGLRAGMAPILDEDLRHHIAEHGYGRRVSACSVRADQIEVSESRRFVGKGGDLRCDLCRRREIVVGHCLSIRRELDDQDIGVWGVSVPTDPFRQDCPCPLGIGQPLFVCGLQLVVVRGLDLENLNETHDGHSLQGNELLPTCMVPRTNDDREARRDTLPRSTDTSRAVGKAIIEWSSGTRWGTFDEAIKGVWGC